jgi:hypothetical protein
MSRNNCSGVPSCTSSDAGTWIVHVKRGEVWVWKRVAINPRPMLTYIIWSNRTNPTAVRIVDNCPDGLPKPNFGFYYRGPDNWAEFWSIKNGNMIFEREFQPSEECWADVGIKIESIDEAGQFLTIPSIEGVNGKETVEEISCGLNG